MKNKAAAPEAHPGLNWRGRETSKGLVRETCARDWMEAPRGELRGELRGDLCGELRGALHGELRGELHGELRGDLCGNLRGDLCGAVGAPFSHTPLTLLRRLGRDLARLVSRLTCIERHIRT